MKILEYGPRTFVAPELLCSISSFVKIEGNHIIRHYRKKCITTQNYEEFGIPYALKPAVKCRNKTEQSANSQLRRLFSQNLQNWRWNKAILRRRGRYMQSEIAFTLINLTCQEKCH